MAPIKFEDNIREKLQERELESGKDAWSKLESQLPASEEKGSRKFLWYAVAASFIGILIIGSLLFNQNESTQDTNDFVLEDVSEKEALPNEDFIVQRDIIPMETIVTPEIASEEKQEEVIAEKVAVVEKIQPEITVEPFVEKTSEAVAQVSEKEIENIPETPVEQKQDLIIKDILLDSKVNEVIAQVQALQKENTTVTAEEIDTLLAQAQRDIQTERILNATKVDAAALLEDVESDMESSFRDKVFDALGDSYTKIRTAVVERNN